LDEGIIVSLVYGQLLCLLCLLDIDRPRINAYTLS